MLERPELRGRAGVRSRDLAVQGPGDVRAGPWLLGECLRPEVTTETGVLSVCAFDGSCDIVKGKCRATSESDCSVSWVCAMQGQCRLVDGQCAK